MFDTSPPTQAELDLLLVPPPSPPPGTFEIGLVLGGTVSAGAYTAGVLDYLVEALDRFEAEKDKGAPWHDVVLKVITGTSGGGVNAAIAARALAYDWTPQRQGGKPRRKNEAPDPFYEVWVNRLRLERFLDTSDIGHDVPSLLNGAAIDEAATWLQTYTAKPRAKPRRWLGTPLTTILTTSNVCGVPNLLAFGDGLSQTFVNHADYLRFAVHYPGQAAFQTRPDENTLGFDGAADPHAVSWADFSLAARATSAFPVGFPTRQLRRPLAQYRYRLVAVPPGPDGQGGVYQPLSPDWALMTGGVDPIPSEYRFSAVDGGATDNEPVELARTTLSGLLGRNPRHEDEADRAVVLVDPFAGAAPVTPPDVSGVVRTAMATLSALLQQTRYSTSDLLLATDPTVFSRFMITSTRDGVSGGKALASSGMGAFIGFACAAFSRHDFMLGRANCKAYLREHFWLGGDNKVFANWTEAQKQAYRRPDGMLPILPLFDAPDTPEPVDPWPRGALDPAVFRAGLEHRFSAIVRAELSGSIGGALFGWLGAHVGEHVFADTVIKAMNESLKTAKLD